ncbi:MAG: ATPase [Solirubrobacterales bacterium]|nr:ATPase [Solirubrobacterales bacterium]
MSGGQLVVAVDGGGVKTDLALVDSLGSVLAVVRGGSSQAHYLGVAGAVDVLEALLDEACGTAGLGRLARPFAATAQILLAGADLPEEVSAIRTGLELRNWSERLLVDSDMPALLRSGTDRGWGIAVVCGTGINCLGLAPDGREARFLSFGPVSGDWGGGRDVGLAALAAAVRAADGRGPASVLREAVPAHFGLADPLEVARAVHLDELPMVRLGELAPVVLAAYDEDAVAASIIRRLADEVVAFARAALHRLELTSRDPDVVLGGRVLRSLPPGVLKGIAREIETVAPLARVVVARSEPIVGAALLGLDALGADPSVKDRARAGLDAAVADLSSLVVERLG